MKIFLLVAVINANSWITIQSFTSRNGCEFARQKTIEPDRLSCLAVNDPIVYESETDEISDDSED